jgi:uncharacterized protein (DUF58 family)
MATSYLDPDVLARVRSLELTARRTIDGVLAGAHRSPRHGFAVEFAHHREYVPGDDVKHLDWKVFGRTERYYLKQYELETDLTCWLAVDASGSMRYASHEVTKYDYACVLAAALAHLVVRQADRVGLAVIDSQVRRFVRPSAQGGQLGEVVRQLAAGPTAEPSDLGTALPELAGRLGRRGVVFVFSDCLDDPAGLLAGLRRLRFDRHELIVVRVADPAEEEFPFASATMFRGLELPEQLLTDPRGLRRAYLNEYAAHADQLRRGCRALDVELLEVRTDAEPGLVLARYLAGRR